MKEVLLQILRQLNSERSFENLKKKDFKYTSATSARCSFVRHNSEEMELTKLNPSYALIGCILEPSNKNPVQPHITSRGSKASC